MIEDVKPPIDTILYICPNAAACGNYYAAPEFRPDRSPDICELQQRRTEQGQEVSFSRLECPACRQRGIHVLRVPYVVTGVVALSDAMRESGAPPAQISSALGHGPMKSAQSAGSTAAGA